MSDRTAHSGNRTIALQGILDELGLRGAARAVRDRLSEASTEGWSSEQFLGRLLADELHHRAEHRRRLTIGENARWFQVDHAPRVSLVRRTALRRLLNAAAEARAHGRAISVQEMVRAGWPRERVSLDKGATRVYTAIRALRKLGLDQVLVTSDAGYEIASEVDVVRQPG